MEYNHCINIPLGIGKRSHTYGMRDCEGDACFSTERCIPTACELKEHKHGKYIYTDTFTFSFYGTK